MKFVHDECTVLSNKAKILNPNFKTSSILTARLLQAIPQLVSNLRSCFIPIQSQLILSYEDFQMTEPNNTSSWDEIVKVFDENCHCCWTYWIEESMKSVDELLLNMPQEFTLATNIDYLLVVSISIEILIMIID